MDLDCQGFAEELGSALVELEYENAWRLLAPWLQQEIGAEYLREQVEEQLRDAADLAGSGHPEHPVSCRIEATDIHYEDLGKPGFFDEPRVLPPELQPENFLYGFCIRFLPRPECTVNVEVWFDLWVLTVDHEGEPRVGYYEIRDAD